MHLYSTSNTTLAPLKELDFKLERDLQRLFEANLAKLTGLQLVKSEFTLKDKRFDTLAYDPQAKSFVIIEYKRNRNYSVFNQGVTYLNLMLGNKAEFIVEYNELHKANLKRADVEWG